MRRERPVSADDPLTPRQRQIMRVVLEDYIASGTPVGSKNITGREGLAVASSTIRYELARLEELGFLDHPHTSAGRVPTERGYRYYVDALIERDQSLAPRDALESALAVDQMRREIDAALGRLAETLSQVTSLLSVITAPAPEAATVRHVEVLLLQPQLVMVVVITSNGAVSKRVFAFDSEVDAGFAEWAGQFFAERVVGLPVGARIIPSRLLDPSLSGRERDFIAALAPAVSELAGDGEALHVGGRALVLAEQTDIAAFGALMSGLEERVALLELLRSALARPEVYLRIGSELSPSGLVGLSMVAANYGIARRNLGTISLFGPTRMDYRLAIATVSQAAQLLSHYLDEVYE